MIVMRRSIITLILGVILLLITSLSAALSGTLELTIERTPTPDTAAIATLSSLMLNGTRYAQQATEIANPLETAPELAVVQGKICYPSGRTPAMTAFFMNTTLRKRFDLPIYENQNSYSVQLPPGKYYAWAVAPQYQIGGYYSEYVVCGMTDSCIDHNQLLFEVRSSENVTGIDICDWPHPLSTEQTSPR
jgi:hypothetical protein